MIYIICLFNVITGLSVFIPNLKGVYIPLLQNISGEV